MYIIILVLVLANLFASVGWLSYLSKLTGVYLEDYSVLFTIVTSLVFVIVPAFFPQVGLLWIVGILVYIILGFYICAKEGDEIIKNLKK